MKVIKLNYQNSELNQMKKKNRFKLTCEEDVVAGGAFTKMSEG